MLIGRGTFRGDSGHTMTGKFSLTQQNDGVLMETSNNFFFDGSPQPDWALFSGVPTDKDDPAVRAAATVTRFGNMPGSVVNIRGKQSGLIPSATNIDDFDTLFLWCFTAPFILGIGPIERV